LQRVRIFYSHFSFVKKFLFLVEKLQPKVEEKKEIVQEIKETVKEIVPTVVQEIKEPVKEALQEPVNTEVPKDEMLPITQVCEKISKLCGFEINVTIDLEKNKSKKNISQYYTEFSKILEKGFTDKTYGKEGLLVWFAEGYDETFRDYIKEIRMFAGPSYNHFKSPGCWYYDLSYENEILFIEVVEGTPYTSTDGFATKMKWLAKTFPALPDDPNKPMKLTPFQKNAEKLIEEFFEKTFKADLNIPIRVDWRNCKVKNRDERAFNQFSMFVQNGFYNLDPKLKDWLKKDQNETLFKENIKEIIILETDDELNIVNGSNYCEIDIFDQKLIATFKSGYGTSTICGGWGEKIEPHIHLHNRVMKEFPCKIKFDWSSLIKFTQGSSHYFSQTMKHFYDEKLSLMKNVISRINEAEISKIGFTKVKTIIFSVDKERSALFNEDTLVLKFQNIIAKYPDMWTDNQINAKKIEENKILEDSVYLEVTDALEILVPALIEIQEKKLANAQTIFSSFTSSKSEFSVDWSFCSHENFKQLKPFEKLQMITLLFSVNICKFMDCLCDLYLGYEKSKFFEMHPRESYQRKMDQLNGFPGTQFLSQHLKKTVFGVDMDEKQPKDYSLKFENGNVNVLFNASKVIAEFKEFYQGKLQKLFDLIVPIAEFDLKWIIESYEKKFSEFSKIKISVDNSFTKDSNYLEYPHEKQFLVARNFFTSMVDHLCSGVYEVTSHPVGKREIVQKIQKIHFIVDSKLKSQSNGEISHLNDQTLLLTANQDNLNKIQNTNWSPRIKSLYNLIVEIAIFDNSEPLLKIEKELAEILGKNVKLEIGTNFTKSEEFKKLNSEDQTEIMRILCTSIMKSCIGEDLINLAKIDCGKEAMKKLNQMILTADEKNQQKDGTVTLNNGILIINQNLNSILNQTDKIKDIFWKSQDALEITKQVALEQSNGRFKNLLSTFNNDFGKETKIQIDYDFTNEEDYKKLKPEVRNNLIFFMNTELMQLFLFGDEGVIGAARFAQEELHKAIQQIVLHLNSKSSSKEYDLTINDGILNSTFNLKDIVNKTKISSCRLKIEKILDLRKIKETRAMNFVDSKIIEENKLKSPVSVDWKSLIDTKKFKESDIYVDLILKVHQLVQFVLFNDLKSCHSGSIDKLNKYKKIIFSVDVTNGVKKKCGLYTPNYWCGSNSDDFTIKTDFDNRQYYGCSMNIDFELSPSFALQQEKNETERRRIEEEKRIAEEKRREEERKKKEDEEKREREKREREEIDKKRKEKCSKYGCKNGIMSCGSCTSYGSTIKNYKCSNCHGQGTVGQCPNCRGTGRQYPDL
jgi:hypothetical protein